MRIVIAPDSFKESLTALEVAQAIKIGFQKILPHAEYVLVPMADGGEGTVQSLVDATQGEIINTEVIAPLGNPIQAFFGLSGDKQTAIIEMAAASGLHLVPVEQRNPLKTTSFGTGQLIKAALDLGVKKIILGIGGSATNDAGVGMLQALGALFLDQHQQPIGFGGEQLQDIMHVDLSQLDPRLSSVELEVACDVNNPLCGPRGASAIFGPQKGASVEMVEKLDNALLHFSHVVEQQYQRNIRDHAGAGAAGGMGGGLLLLPNVFLKAGVEIVIKAVKLDTLVANADLVITGEGRMDSQTAQGKTPSGVAKTAKQFQKPVLAIVGSLKEDYEVVYQAGIDAVFPIIRQVESLEATLKCGRENLISAAQNIARFYLLAKHIPD
ncbi:glycerate kinase [Pasteurella multocida]|uniref:Glycerate kinase n=3 Tax=Pasteurella multocida TaxID=747 RepID=A0AAW8V9T7_PASMD|nr:glycerate kinase [Pasteurella multocida]MDH7436920.1 glycerate kinase [Pasteurella multocida]MDH7439280.1 glycerate kinase [Pasteurella multocida]MDT3453313.1 glycerate kinase [Pasteurella multocida]MDY0433955.1 glycerate kinase [Pasteurella multocida]MDY0438160.1 glycerate kinase [Pasteurella multocida]